MKECMKDTLITPVLAGSVLAFTLAMAAIGAHDAAKPFPETAATRPIGKEKKQEPLIAAAMKEVPDSRELQSLSRR